MKDYACVCVKNIQFNTPTVLVKKVLAVPPTSFYSISSLLQFSLGATVRFGCVTKCHTLPEAAILEAPPFSPSDSQVAKLKYPPAYVLVKMN